MKKKNEIIPFTDENKDIKKVKISWTYLHGKLEEDATYDIFGFKDEFMGHKTSIDSKTDLGFQQAVIECEYKGKECLLYLWRNNTSLQTGYAVYRDDEEANKQALKKMMEKSDFI